MLGHSIINNSSNYSVQVSLSLPTFYLLLMTEETCYQYWLLLNVLNILNILFLLKLTSISYQMQAVCKQITITHFIKLYKNFN